MKISNLSKINERLCPSVVITALIMVALLGFGNMAESQKSPPDSGPAYRVDKLTEHELELVHNLLIEKGHKGLTPTQGTHKWSIDKKQPQYFTVVCGKSNGGIVRVEIKMTKYPLEETFIKILK